MLIFVFLTENKKIVGLSNYKVVRDDRKLTIFS